MIVDEDFIFDENGQISDDDQIYEKLDEWHENDEYDNILETVYAIPREMWSNKLWFRMISALNNKKEFDKAKEELDKIIEICKTPSDKGSAYYMLGYMFYMQNKDIKALYCYRRAMKEDPERDLQSECDDCQRYIDESLNKLEEMSDDVIKLIDNCLKTVPKKDKIKINENIFALLIGIIPSARKIPCIDKCIGLDSIFDKYEEDEKEAVRQWLLRVYNVKDIKTLITACNDNFNVSGKYDDIVAYMSGKPNFDLDIMDKNVKLMWDSCMMFCEKIVGKVPKGGVTAWDIGERTGLVRYAYACDIITDSEYVLAVMELTDEIKKRYSSWNEYLAGYIFGSGIFMLLVSDFSIDESIDFMCKIAKVMLESDIPQCRWIESSRRTIKFEN